MRIKGFIDDASLLVSGDATVLLNGASARQYTHDPQGAVEHSIGGLVVFIAGRDHVDQLGDALMISLKEHLYGSATLLRGDAERLEHFEQALKSINQDLLVALRDYPRADMQVLIALVRPPSILLTRTGNTFGATLVRKHHSIDILNETTEAEQAYRLKLFDEVIQGELQSGDILALGAPLIGGAVSGTTLRQLAQSTSTEAKAKEIAALLQRSHRSGTLFSFVNLELPHAHAAPSPRKSERSMSSLLSLQSDTQSFLRMSFSQDLKKWVRALTLATANFFNWTKKRFISLIVSLRSLRSSPKAVVTQVATLPLQASEKIQRRTHELLEDTPQRVTFWFSGRTPKQRVVVVVGLICILLFSQNVLRLGGKKVVAIDESAYTMAIDTLRDKRDAIEANLLIANFTGAENYIAEYEQILSSLPRTSTQKEEKYIELNTEFNQLLEKVERRVRISDMREVLTIQETGAGLPLALLPSDSPTRWTVLRTTTAYRTDEAGSTVVIEDETLRAAAHLGNSSVIIGDNQLYESTTLTGSYAVRAFPQGSTVRSVGLYENNLYVLSDTQIIRWRRGTSYAAGTNWFRNPPADIASAVDFAIDGSIYILYPDTIKLFVRGAAQAFSLDVTPTEATKITTSTTSSNLYVLEPPSGKILVFSKKGTLLRQLMHDQIKQALDFSINELTKKGYILTTDAVYEFSLE